MSLDVEPATVLSEDECWYLLATRTLGRLATVVAGQPEIFPVNFVVQRPTVLFRTAEGRKLLSAVMDDRVAFEADDHDFAAGWSVVVKGRAEAMTDSADLERAERAQLLSWIPNVKSHYVRIVAAEITGRRFQFGAEPGRRSNDEGAEMPMNTNVLNAGTP
jgi:nitroimidazol reductase NimA-like FMN-containing flavoprotein (pyridoxamine 5'-phosphate oxidase superfamily)